MKHKLFILACIGLIIGIVLTVINFKDMQKAESILMKNSDYVEATNLNDAVSELRSASSNLTYEDSWIQNQITIVNGISTVTLVTHPAEYPDPKYAKEYISRALKRIANWRLIVNRVSSINESLPNQNNLKNHKGVRVNNSTFQSQRSILRDSAEELKKLADDYMNNVPEKLRRKKEKSTGFFILSLLLSLGSGVFGFFRFPGIL